VLHGPEATSESATLLADHRRFTIGVVLWRRASVPEPPLDREDVIAIFDALTDIKKWTHDMWSVIVGEDQANEDEPR
jgi:hypothetical protein